MHCLSIHKSFKSLEIARKISSFVAGLALLHAAPATYAQTPDEIYSQMSVQQKVGQVFIWTYSGSMFTSIMRRWLERFQPGALIVFGRNIKSPVQIARYNADLQALAGLKLKAPFFLMIDQEGGIVTRLRTSVPLPSALALGRMGDAKFIEGFGKASASVLRDVGFNVNLAPVLDISNPNRDSFIGNRAFGEDPEDVATLAVAYARGVSDGGMLPTAKHFPGHGGVKQDSHQTTPRKLATYAELADKDIVPFEEYSQSGFPKAVMMAHLSLPNVDVSGVPATYSSVLIGDYLRRKLKYDGLVITDDLEMSGASLEKDIGERAIKAFLAGNDMLMLAGAPINQHHAFNAMLAAVNSGRISEARLKESVLRILNYKKDLKLGPFQYDETKTQTAIAAVEKLSREVLSKNFRQSVKGKTAKWPELSPDTQALVLSSDKRFFDGFAAQFKGKALFYHLTPQSLYDAPRVLARPRFRFAVYYASGTRTARWLAHLPNELRAKIIVVNSNHAAEVENQDSFMSVLNVNSHCPECGLELAQALAAPDLRLPASEDEPPLENVLDPVDDEPAAEGPPKTENQNLTPEQ
jgi:beta-N-acetylhexosaminidase